MTTVRTNTFTQGGGAGAPTTTTVIASCVGTEVATGGGCETAAASGAFISFRPVPGTAGATPTGFQCVHSTRTTVTAYVICAPGPTP